jgi:ribosomal protein S10
MLIHLKIFSKNKVSLILFFKVIKKIRYKKDLKLKFCIKKLERIKTTRVFNVLKSPHANKTAQEQFQYFLYSKKIIFYTFQFLKLILVLRKLHTQLFSDIQIKICFSIKHYNLETYKNKIFNLKLYILKMFKTRIIVNKIFLYLQLFDLQGVSNLK